MDTPSSAPHVDDLRVYYGRGKNRRADWAYGPRVVKILARYMKKDKGGLFTQRNENSFAWFAIAKYVEKEIGRYPRNPNVKDDLNNALRNSWGNLIFRNRDEESNDEPGTSDPNSNPEDPELKDDPHWAPGCPDSNLPLDGPYGESSVNPQGPIDPKCDTQSVTDFPYNVSHGLEGSIFDHFCFAVDSNL